MRILQTDLHCEQLFKWKNFYIQKSSFSLKTTFIPFDIFYNVRTLLYSSGAAFQHSRQQFIMLLKCWTLNINKQQRLKCCVCLITERVCCSPFLHSPPLLAYNLNAESTNNGEVSAAGWGQFCGRLGNMLCMCLCIL